MRTLAIVAALAAGVFSATLSAEARNICHHDGAKWVGCGSLGAPGVEPGRQVSVGVPQKDARPADGCVLIGTERGHQRWRCPPGTAQRLRDGVPGIPVLKR